MKIAVATDHAGFDALSELKDFIVSLGHEYVDCGPTMFDPDDDYPDFIFPAANAVAKGECERGVILGGSGQGEAMAANRVRGVRCAVFYSPAIAKQAINAEGDQSTDPYEIVKLSRTHNNANVLSLSGRFLTIEEMKQAIRVWLETPFSGLERHNKRNIMLDQSSV